ncbi:uncharacterized protein LOC113307686 [Papaver somniferum]|uniref:uncharacterized protein LOC113307686 n=1 Tax=Papaver somniferum TaxID=3469 RepID=UPI000E6FCC5E|nr:uncharacterized protein LOC113307686 [Papaver somniferum]
MEELRKASRVGISQVSRNVSLLQAWIYDHFPILKLAIQNPTWKKGDSRGTKYVFDDNYYRTKEQHLIRLREVLGSLTAQEVCFDPYKEDRAGGHIAGRSDLALYFGPLWHPTGYVMYNASRVMRQHGFVQGIPKEEIHGNFSLVLEECTSDKDSITVVHKNKPSCKLHWDRRVHYLINLGRPANKGFENAPNYMEWYLSVSHIRVIRDLKPKPALYKSILKDKPVGYERLKGRFKSLSKWCTNCIKAGEPVPLDKIRKHQELIDNIDNIDYASQFGEKAKQPKKIVKKRTRASSSTQVDETNDNVGPTRRKVKGKK